MGMQYFLTNFSRTLVQAVAHRGVYPNLHILPGSIISWNNIANVAVALREREESFSFLQFLRCFVKSLLIHSFNNASVSATPTPLCKRFFFQPFSSSPLFFCLTFAVGYKNCELALFILLIQVLMIKAPTFFTKLVMVHIKIVRVLVIFCQLLWHLYSFNIWLYLLHLWYT